ncbi:uncharacterized protein LOC119857899 isoform X2 [Dermochelys coriacea]|uniref:uncharacterized protein LOC119857899 isoform X2 n=1 Tax=Dermochelys coriacea TaxID=27794 RepID=UPI0018E747CF|nr:uncharacterized protein LOC119857899 isoform X2 [Dermochelys coriacea]
MRADAHRELGGPQETDLMRSLQGQVATEGRCLKQISEFSVLQQPPRVVKEAGASVAMNCTLTLPPGHPRPSSILVTWHRGPRGVGLMGTGKLSEVEELRGRVETAWLENVSASTLHIHTLQRNDSALYLCLFVVFPSAQPCVLEGNGTRLTVTGFSTPGNTTRPGPHHSTLASWQVFSLGLGALGFLVGAFLLCLHRKRTGLASRVLHTSPLAGAGDSAGHSLRLMKESPSEGEGITYTELSIQPRTQRRATTVNSRMMAEEITYTHHSIQPPTQSRTTKASSPATSPSDTVYAAVRKGRADSFLY